MILVTGGAGFIGSHTVRALHDLGEELVLFQRRTPDVPPQLPDLPVRVVQGDVADLDRLLEVGRTFPITGIVHLAVALPWPATADPVGDTGRAVDAFLNIVRAAQAWGVPRVVTASTIGVYGGLYVEGALTEDLPLSMRNLHVIPTFKKITELLGGYLAEETGVRSSTPASPAPGGRAATCRTRSSPRPCSRTRRRTAPTPT
jgi:UDP-glucose 4-epimerase